MVTFATTTGAMAMEAGLPGGGAAGAADPGAPEHHRRLRDVLVCAAGGPADLEDLVIRRKAGCGRHLCGLL